MVAITSLSEADQSEFVQRIAPIETLVNSCIKENVAKMVETYVFHSSSPEMAQKYIKFHHYILVSCSVDFLAIIAAQEFSIDYDEPFKTVLENVKANFSVNTFNNSILSNLPKNYFAPIHGQEILLFRALEKASLFGGVSFFGYQKLRNQFAEALSKDMSESNKDVHARPSVSWTSDLFGSVFADLTRLRSVNFYFSKITAEYAGGEQRKFISAFENFMNSLPLNVDHCYNGKTVYSEKGFMLPCACGTAHLIDECNAICDGGHAHYAVFRSPCETTISKVISEGFFWLKGVKIVSTITAEKMLIDCVEQAVSSRKRID